MKFLVKHNKAPGRVFLSDEYIGLTPDPVFSAKSDAFEYYFEPYGLKGPSPKVTIHGDVTLVEPA